MAAYLFIVFIPKESGQRKATRKPKNLKYDYDKYAEQELRGQESELNCPSSIASPCRQIGKAAVNSSTNTPELQYGTFSTTPNQLSLSIERMQQRELRANSIAIPVETVAHKKPLDTRALQTNTNQENKGNQAVNSAKIVAPTKHWDGLRETMSSVKSESAVQVREQQSQKQQQQQQQQEQLPKQDTFNGTPTSLPVDSSFEQIVLDILLKLKIVSSSWLPTRNGQNLQVIFTVDTSRSCERVLEQLTDWGIGERKGTSVSVVPCSISFKSNGNGLNEQAETESEKDDIAQKEGAWNRFMSSVTARLNVAQIVEEVKSSALLTFDFVCLLIVAAILAAFGLVEGSTLFLAASMLISPLMGPIVAGIFGTVIKDRKLQMLGFYNEFLGILIATCVGFVFGIVACILDAKYSTGNAFTNEMKSRCEIHSLLVGVLIALPSGAAIAIAILGDNIGSLVGVAISASLLPPAVNAGVIWALACVYAIYESDNAKYNSVINSTLYSEHQSIELAVMGSISMFVTLTNVFCIYAMGVVFLKIKEVAPIVSRNQRQFWKHDIKIARDYNKTIQSEHGYTLSAQLADELSGFQRNESLHHQNTWSPMSSRHHLYFNERRRPTAQDLEAIYLNMNRDPKQKHIFGRGFSPQYRTINDDYLHNTMNAFNPHLLRRSSAPFDNGTHQRRQSAPLHKIMENQRNNCGAENQPDKASNASSELSVGTSENKSRVFVVTPVNPQTDTTTTN